MSSRVIVSAFLIILLVSLLVFLVEFFIPLSAKSDLNLLCRNTLLSMEVSGGLQEEDKIALKQSLEDKGFQNVTVDGPIMAKHGEALHLQVEADYTYSRLTSVFVRQQAVIHMVYSKTSLARRVIN